MATGTGLDDPNLLLPPSMRTGSASQQAVHTQPQAASAGGGGLDDPNLFLPPSMRAAGVPRQPGQGASDAFDSAGQFLLGKYQQAQGTVPGRFITSALTTGGKVLQPFSAPQQLLFGAIGGLESLAHGNAQQAYETLKAGSKAALGDLTYGLYNAGQNASKTGQDARDNSVTGYDLFKGMGAAPWLAKWGGLAADFFLDVPVVGKAGKLAKLDKIGGLDAKFAQVFTSGNDLQKFAAHIIAAPMSNAPLKHLVNAFPENNIGNLAGRTQMSENIGTAIENARFTPQKALFGAASPSAAETIVSDTGRVQGIAPVNTASLAAGTGPKGTGLPDAYVAVKRDSAAIKANLAMRIQQAGQGIMSVTKGLDADQRLSYQTIVNHLIDHNGEADQQHWHDQLKNFATQTQGTNSSDWIQQVEKHLRDSTQADVFGAVNLGNTGLMHPALVKQYESGDIGHLRRMFSLYERPQQILERIAANNTPHAITFDTPQLQSFFADVIARSKNTGQIKGNAASIAADVKQTALAVSPTKAAQGRVANQPDILTAMSNANLHPDDIKYALQTLGGQYSARAGIKYVPMKNEMLTAAQGMLDNHATSYGGAGSLIAGSSAKPFVARKDLPDWLMEGIGEVQDHMQRVDRQAQVVGTAVSNRMVSKGFTDLMMQDGVIKNQNDLLMSPAGMSGWRQVTDQMATQLNQPILSGKYIPAIFHRQLVDTINIKDPTVTSAAYDWATAAWRRAKLASVPAIARNLGSGYIAAYQYGILPHELFQGALDYSKLVKGAVKAGDTPYQSMLDQTFSVHGTTMKELMDHGELFHSSMLQKEVVNPMSNFTDHVANSAGSPLQKHAALVSQWLQDVQAGDKGSFVKGAVTAASLVGDAAGLGTGPITKKLTDIYGLADMHTKGAIYMALKKKGMAPLDAAKHADEALFNYENVPLIVHAARKAGLIGLPFASYQVLSAGRLIKNIYERPYHTAAGYRIGQSTNNDLSQQQQESEYFASPDQIKKGVWLRMGQRNGNPSYVNFSSFLPETPVWDTASTDVLSNYTPPLLGLYSSIIAGQGYQGMSTYNGGKNFAQTYNADPKEAARGALKALSNFGTTPWAPGQPLATRIADSIAAHSVSPEFVASSVGQTFLKAYQNGIAGLPFAPPTVGAQKIGSTPIGSNLDYALGAVGITKQNVQVGGVGTSRNNMSGDTAQISLLKKQQLNAMKSVDPKDEEGQARVREYYKGLLQNAAQQAQQDEKGRKQQP